MTNPSVLLTDPRARAPGARAGPEAYPAPMTSLPRRLAIAAGAILATLALAVTFAPASSSGNDCGTWVAPDGTASRILDDLAAKDPAATLGLETGRAILAERARAVADECADTLQSRRSWALGLLVLALMVPAGIAWATRTDRGRIGEPDTRHQGHTAPTNTDQTPRTPTDTAATP